MKYTVVLSPDPKWGGYSVTCPALPGAISQGETRDVALANIREAMDGWLEVAREQEIAPLDETRALILKEIDAVLDDRTEGGWDMEVELATVETGQAVAA